MHILPRRAQMLHFNKMLQQHCPKAQSISSSICICYTPVAPFCSISAEPADPKFPRTEHKRMATLRLAIWRNPPATLFWRSPSPRPACVLRPLRGPPQRQPVCGAVHRVQGARRQQGVHRGGEGFGSRAGHAVADP